MLCAHGNSFAYSEMPHYTFIKAKVRSIFFHFILFCVLNLFGNGVFLLYSSVWIKEENLHTKNGINSTKRHFLFKYCDVFLIFKNKHFFFIFFLHFFLFFCFSNRMWNDPLTCVCRKKVRKKRRENVSAKVILTNNIM